jgi:hypothetical protein
MLARLNTYQNFRLRRHLSPSCHSITFYLFIFFNGSLTIITHASKPSHMSTVHDNTNMLSHYGAMEALGNHDLLRCPLETMTVPYTPWYSYTIEYAHNNHTRSNLMNRICKLMMILHTLQNLHKTPTSSTSIYHMSIKLQFDISKYYVNPRDFKQQPLFSILPDNDMKVVVAVFIALNQHSNVSHDVDVFLTISPMLIFKHAEHPTRLTGNRLLPNEYHWCRQTCLLWL